MQYDPNKGGMRRPTRQPGEKDDSWAVRGPKRGERRPPEQQSQPAPKREAERPSSLYDDFDTFYDRRPRRRAPVKKRHTAAWAVLFLLLFAAEAALCALMAPQLFGITVPGLPVVAFAGGGVITYDAAAVANVQAMEDTAAYDRIYPGVIIDGVNVGGMTVDEARAAVEAVEPTGGGAFSVTVESMGQTWTISSETTPVTRNTEEMLRRAYAAGRDVPSATRNGGPLPAQYRQDAVDELARHPLVLTTCLTYDTQSVETQCRAIADFVSLAPVSAQIASFDFGTCRFTVTQDADGRVLDADALYEAVTAVITGAGTGEVSMQPQTVRADITSQELSARLGRVSTYTTTTTNNKNRNTNISLSAQAINGIVVQPGDTFSFNNATGQRTAAKGYKEATAISGGQTRPEVGGGVCQTSSTLFNAVARANLQIDTRSPHAWPSSYVTEGMDATVNWPSLDFRFTNTSEWPIYIVAKYENRAVKVDIYGYTLGEGITIDLKSVKTQTLTAPSGIKEVQNPELPAGTRQTTVSARNGSVWETYRVWYRDGVEFSRELLCTSTYKAYQETVEYN